MPTMLDRIRMPQRGETAPPPVATLIGFALTSIEPLHTLEPMIQRDAPLDRSA
jgi:hypothetical protein